MVANEDRFHSIDHVEAYLHEVGSYPLLSEAEEVALAKRIQQGDQAAYTRFVQSNLRLVVSVAKKYANQGMELLDLIQEGNLGLMHAIRKFDPDMGYRFSTYATWWIRQYVQRHLIEQAHAIRLPVHVSEKVYRVKKVRTLLHAQLGREATLKEIALAARFTEQEVENFLVWDREMISIDAPASAEDEDYLVGDTLVDPRAISPEDSASQSGLREAVSQALATLQPRERAMIADRFGLGGDHAATLEELGRKYRLTRERVRQIVNDSMRKLRLCRQARGLSDYY